MRGLTKSCRLLMLIDVSILQAGGIEHTVLLAHLAQHADACVERVRTKPEIDADDLLMGLAPACAEYCANCCAGSLSGVLCAKRGLEDLQRDLHALNRRMFGCWKWGWLGCRVYAAQTKVRAICGVIEDLCGVFESCTRREIKTRVVLTHVFSAELSELIAQFAAEPAKFCAHKSYNGYLQGTSR